MTNEPKSILLVDDEEDLVTALVDRLEANGYKVMVAKDGLEALKKARTHHPDLIILDLMLPRMDGYKVARLLKFDNRYSNIPIIILSARGQELDRKLGEKAGADDYIVKPFESAELIDRVRQLIQKKEKAAKKTGEGT